MWFLQNGLQQNANKSEVMILGTPAQLRLAAVVSVVDVAGTALPVSSQLKSLGVIIDSYMHFDSHVGAVIRACNCRTRALQHVHEHLTTEKTQTIACRSSRHVYTAKTRCCMALLLQSSRNCRELKTTSPRSSVSSTAVFMLDRY